MFKAITLALLVLSAAPATAANPWRYGSPTDYAQQDGQWQEDKCGAGIFHKNPDQQLSKYDYRCQDHDQLYWDRYPTQTTINRGFWARNQVVNLKRQRMAQAMHDAQGYADQVANAPPSGAALREQVRPIDLIQMMPPVTWPPQ